jgi:hypothetical protein
MTSHQAASGAGALTTVGQSLVEFALILPVMLLLLLAVADLARIYTTMTAIEAAAREAADYGAFDSTYWTEPAATRTEMRRRACVAASHLPDYEPKAGADDACTNPTIVSMRVLSSPGTEATDERVCVRRTAPCWVEVTMEHRFQLLVPVNFTFYDLRIGFPSEVVFQRTSTFAMGDLTFESQSPPPGTPGPGTDPTDAPTESPSESPSVSPEVSASAEVSPSAQPSDAPSASASAPPAPPTVEPTASPSVSPSVSPDAGGPP